MMSCSRLTGFEPLAGIVLVTIDQVLLLLLGLYRVLPDFTGFYRVLLSFTGFY